MTAHPALTGLAGLAVGISAGLVIAAALIPDRPTPPPRPAPLLVVEFPAHLDA